MLECTLKSVFFSFIEGLSLGYFFPGECKISSHLYEFYFLYKVLGAATI